LNYWGEPERIIRKTGGSHPENEGFIREGRNDRRERELPQPSGPTPGRPHLPGRTLPAEPRSAESRRVPSRPVPPGAQSAELCPVPAGGRRRRSGRPSGSRRAG